jgi:hypothetical protein
MAENVETRPPAVLTPEQCAFYRENGWLLVERAVPETWLARLRDAVTQIVDGTRSMTVSSGAIDLWRDHSAEDPRLWHVDSPDDMQPAIWEFFSDSILLAMTCDLFGSPVQYRYGVIRFRELGPCDLWHQDMPFDDLDGEAVLAGIHLHDTGPTHPRLQLIPGSHRGETFSHLDANGEFLGELNPEEMARIESDAAIDLVAPAGSIEFLDVRTLHQDLYGGVERGGVLLYASYATADAVSIGEARYPDVPSRRKGSVLAA